MKKIISVILCLALVIGSCAVIASADDDAYSDYPVIMVPGYSSTWLIDDNTGEQIWGLDFNKVITMILENIADVGASLGSLSAGNTEKIAALVGNGAIQLLGKMAFDDNGQPVYPLHELLTCAADSQYSYLLEKYDGDIGSELEWVAEIADRIGGYDNIFCFSTDFRYGSEHCAEDLNEFVQSVKEFTGKDKVNIIAVSHGGQTVSTYLTLFGQYTNDVNNVVMTVPAIGGAGLAYDALTGDVHLDEECLIRFIEFGTMTEINANWLVKAQELGILDDIIADLLPYLYQIIENWVSLWDFVPADKYEYVKSLRLDPDENAGLIATSDRYHYDIQPNVSAAFRACQANGANLSIVAGYGNDIVSGLQENSDGIICVKDSTGATAAPLGSRFADGYTQINECNGNYKVSPSMTIDASTAYLPDNTWFINGLYHGMTLWDYYAKALILKLLLTTEPMDVYSDVAYPQFMDSHSPSLGVYAEFEGCTPGYISSSATKLKLTNYCNDAKVRITSVTAEGIDLTFKINPLKVLKPGESMEVEFSGTIPEVSRQAANITVTFVMDNITPADYRTQTFTIMNGADAESSGGFVTIGGTSLDSLIGEKWTSFLKNLGLNEFFSMIWYYLSFWMNTVKAVF